MKRIKKLLFGSIRSKFFLLILITMALFAANFFGVTAYQNYRLSQLASETSRKQQASIAEITNTVMTEEIRSDLTRVTALEAMIADDIFLDAKSRVTLVSQFAARMFANPAIRSWRSLSGKRWRDKRMWQLFPWGTRPII